MVVLLLFDSAAHSGGLPHLFNRADVIGVCTRLGELQRFTSRASGKEFIKRDIQLVDKSGREVGLFYEK